MDIKQLEQYLMQSDLGIDAKQLERFLSECDLDDKGFPPEELVSYIRRQIYDFKRLMAYYRCAIMEIETKIQRHQRRFFLPIRAQSDRKHQEPPQGTDEHPRQAGAPRPRFQRSLH